jgi:hypothetical protein
LAPLGFPEGAAGGPVWLPHLHVLVCLPPGCDPDLLRAFLARSFGVVGQALLQPIKTEAGLERQVARIVRYPFKNRARLALPDNLPPMLWDDEEIALYRHWAVRFSPRGSRAFRFVIGKADLIERAIHEVDEMNRRHAEEHSDDGGLDDDFRDDDADEVITTDMAAVGEPPADIQALVEDGGEAMSTPVSCVVNAVDGLSLSTRDVATASFRMCASMSSNGGVSSTRPSAISEETPAPMAWRARARLHRWRDLRLGDAGEAAEELQRQSFNDSGQFPDRRCSPVTAAYVVRRMPGEVVADIPVDACFPQHRLDPMSERMKNFPLVRDADTSEVAAEPPRQILRRLERPPMIEIREEVGRAFLPPGGDVVEDAEFNEARMERNHALRRRSLQSLRRSVRHLGVGRDVQVGDAGRLVMLDVGDVQLAELIDPRAALRCQQHYPIASTPEDLGAGLVLPTPASAPSEQR